MPSRCLILAGKCATLIECAWSKMYCCAEHVAEQAGSLEAPQQGRLAAPGAQSSVHEGAGQTLQAKQGEQPQVAQQAEQAQDTQHEHQSRAVQLPQTGDCLLSQ